MVAVESDNVAFLVLLAGPGIPGEEMLYLQSELIMRPNGAPSPAIAANRVVQETMFKIVLEEEDAATRRERVHESLTRLLVESGDQLGIPPSSREAFIQGQLQATTSEWFRFFLVHDPVPVLERVRVPVLALEAVEDLPRPGPGEPVDRGRAPGGRQPELRGARAAGAEPPLPDGGNGVAVGV